MTKELAKNELDYTDVGTDERHVAGAPRMDRAIDEALDLQPISIRLQKSLVDNLKSLAQLNGIGYQPLVRQILTRWVDSELKNMLRERIAQEETLKQANPLVAKPKEREEARPMQKAA